MQGSIAKWSVAEGQSFGAGDILAEIETDKATMGWESQDEGIMGKILVPSGTKDVPVGKVVALTVDDESELAGVANYKPGSSRGARAAAPATPAARAAKAATTPAAGSSVFPPHQVWAMPALSPTMMHGNIAKWCKQVGDEVAAGDGMVEVETDKATMMWESVEEGFVAKILAPDGTQDIAVCFL
jgi:pyruvate dehydrogenase E2 component (dihydrolipoamide acetyltransferase)